jgi:hypothetical protein
MIVGCAETLVTPCGYYELIWQPTRDKTNVIAKCYSYLQTWKILEALGTWQTPVIMRQCLSAITHARPTTVRGAYVGHFC